MEDEGSAEKRRESLIISDLIVASFISKPPYLINIIYDIDYSDSRND